MASVIITANLPDIEQRKAPVEQIGLVISTCGTPAYVHLQLEASRRWHGHAGMPTLVVNDGDTDEYAAGRLKELCDEYEADFHCEPYRGHSHGDLNAFHLGLVWAEQLGLSLLAKFSRRFLPLRHWRHELLALAAINQHCAAFGRYHDDNPGHLFRTDAIALRVQKWRCGRVKDTFSEALDRARHVAVENVFNALMKCLGGYEIWQLLGRDFYRPTSGAVQWRGVLPHVYADFAREWGLPYVESDFTEKATGVLIQNESPDLTAAMVEKVKGYKQDLDDASILKAREWEFRQRCEAKNGDIQEHLPLLRKLAEDCDHITELGVRAGNSACAFLCASPKKYVGYDLMISEAATNLANLAGTTEFHLVRGDSLQVDIEETDLLMIDSLHTYAQLKAELYRHASKARKYIVLHDTATFGEKGEDGKEPGLRAAVRDVLGLCESSQKHSMMPIWPSPWAVLHDLKNNNGLMVLQRVPAPVRNGHCIPERLGFAAGVRQALGI